MQEGTREFLWARGPVDPQYEGEEFDFPLVQGREWHLGGGGGTRIEEMKSRGDCLLEQKESAMRVRPASSENVTSEGKPRLGKKEC